MVISHMDMQAATRFASLSRACRVLVNSRKIYHENLRFAGKTLRAMVATDTLQHHSMTKVNEALKASHCAKCSNFGDLLFLPTCERCRLVCFEHHPYFKLMTLEETKSHGLTDEMLRGVPGVSVCSHLEDWGADLDGNSLVSISPTTVAYQREAIQQVRLDASGLSFGNPTDHANAVGQGESEDRRREKREWFDKVTKRFREFDYVFRGMIFLPRLTEAGTLEQGRFCTGCLSGLHHEVLHLSENETGVSLSGYVSVPGCHFQTARLPAEFLAHFRRCPGARSIGSVTLETSPALLQQISADDAGLVVLGTFATGNPQMLAFRTADGRVRTTVGNLGPMWNGERPEAVPLGYLDPAVRSYFRVRRFDLDGMVSYKYVEE